jgi:hypothetical protein
VAALVQAGALLINHIAPGNRTLAPLAGLSSLSVFASRKLR